MWSYSEDLTAVFFFGLFFSHTVFTICESWGPEEYAEYDPHSSNYADNDL